MKIYFICLAFVAVCYVCLAATGFGNNALYMDVHHLGAGKVTYKMVADAHKKDLAVEKKYGVKFIKFWVDEKRGDVYCLSSAPGMDAIRNTHREAHGLLPEQIVEVVAGNEAAPVKGLDYYLDRHELGAGKVAADAVAEAHKKDLAVQDKFGVNFINYWIDLQDGMILCLSQAPDSSAVINTHKEAHGLLPTEVSKVKQGN